MKATNDLPVTVTAHELQTLCRRWAARSVHLCGEGGALARDAETGALLDGGRYVKVHLASAVGDFFTRMADGLNDPKTIEQRNEFLKKAEKDPAVKAQLCALRVEQFQNYALAHQNIIPFFFEQVNLADGEAPYAQNNTMQEIKVKAVAEDGEPLETKIVKPQTEEAIPLIEIATEEVNYTIKDIYKGRIVEAALATIDLAYDMANERERRAFALISGAGVYGTFNYTTGPRHLRTRNLNSRINVANLPTTNDIIVPGTTEESLFRTSLLAEISMYADKWVGSFPGRDLMATGRILVPAGDIAGLAGEFNVTSEGNSVKEQVWQDGYSRIRYLGKTWTLVPDNTLEPGVAYPEFNIKPGKVFNKPSQDVEIIDNSIQMLKKNRESRLMKSPFAAYINFVMRPFVARFRYRLAAVVP